MTEEAPTPFGYEYRQSQKDRLSTPQRNALELLVSCRIELIRSTQWRCKAPWNVPQRIINNEFFLFVLDGALEVESPMGKRVIGRGEFFYTAPGEAQAFGFTGRLNHVEHILVHCRVALPKRPLHRRLFTSSFLELPHTDTFLEQLSHLPYLWETWSDSAQGCAETLLRTLFMDLSLRPELMAGPPPAIDERIADAVTLIRARYREDVSIGGLAKEVELSEVHLRRLFHKATGKTPLSFLTGVRIQEACTQLQTTRKKVKEVARDCGFRDVDYFCRVFKQNQGCNPSDYRKHGSQM